MRDSGGEAAGGEAGAAAQTLNSAGVHRLLRDLHQDDEHARANLTGGFRGGEDDARRLTESSSGGGAPAKPSRRRGARASRQIAPRGSLPRGGSTEQLQATGRRQNSDGQDDSAVGSRRRS
jgi:hypothetical protein